MRVLRYRLVALIAVGAAAALVAAGCGTTPEGSAQPGASASPSATTSGAPAPDPGDTRIPVEKAGGLCKLLSYRSVATTLGAHFDVAASAGGGCALQVQGHKYPDLTLTAADTEADVEKFSDTVPPEGAQSVDDLGKAAYRAVLGPQDGSGPRAEVGWLVGKKIYLLRYSHERGISKQQARQMSKKLVKLARQLKTG